MCRPPTVVERNKSRMRAEEDAALPADAAETALPGSSKALVADAPAAHPVRDPIPTRNLPKGAFQRFWAWTSQTRPTWREDRKEAAVAFTVFSITGSTR